MITGVNAKLIIDSATAAYITNWSVEMQTALAEIIVLGSSDKSSLPIEQTWTGSAEGLIMAAGNQSADAETSGALINKLTAAFNEGRAVAIDFDLKDNKLSGSALIESLSFEISAGEIPKISISVSGASKLVLAENTNVVVGG